MNVTRRCINPSAVAKEPGCCLTGKLRQRKITVLPSKDNVMRRIQGN
jgi:hypothetical protein